MRAEIRSLLFAGEAAATAASAKLVGASSGAVAPEAADEEAAAAQHLVQLLRGGKKGMDSKAVIRLMNMLVDSGKAVKTVAERSYRTARPGHQPSAAANMVRWGEDLFLSESSSVLNEALETSLPKSGLGFNV